MKENIVKNLVRLRVFVIGKSNLNWRLWKPEAVERKSLKSMKSRGVIVSRISTFG
jgi:hypothetical protein